jgi:hypothetical protein
MTGDTVRPGRFVWSSEWLLMGNALKGITWTYKNFSTKVIK